MVKLSWKEDILEEIDHKKPCEEAVMNAPKQWKKHLDKIK
jgi:hypothetical protein